MMKIIKTAGVVVFQDNSVLLVYHGEESGHLNGTYGIPAGRLELNESAIETAVRELYEETSLVTTIKHLIKVPEEYSAAIEGKEGSIRNYQQDIFLCTHWSGELKANDETTPEWIRITDLDTLTLLPNVQKMVIDALKFTIKFKSY